MLTIAQQNTNLTMVLLFRFQELREAYEEEADTTGRPRLLVTAAVGAGKGTIDSAYEVEEIAK